MTAKQEILPPEQPRRPGNPNWQAGGPSPNPQGRPVGQPIGFTRTVRDGLKAALENMGGAEAYFTFLAAVDRPLFVQLLGRAMPIKIVGDDAEVFTIERVERTIIVKK